MTKQDSLYIKNQRRWIKRNKVRVGMKVKVTRAAESNERGWQDTWVGEMDEAVGKERTISELPTRGSYQFNIRLDDSWNYPYFVLRVVGKNKKRKRSTP